MKRIGIAMCAGVAVAVLGAPLAVAQSNEEIWASQESMEVFDASLDRQSGGITLLGGDVVLDIPKTLYFLDADDAKRVIVDAWDNPAADGTIGMIFAAGTSPLNSGVWGVEVQWDDSGYVSDEDAATIDYDELLESMQSDVRRESERRVSSGYDSVNLVGWAAPPSYDAGTHKLYWARELNFGGVEKNTLNYNIRVLGREGVLVLNFIADIDALSDIETVAPDVLRVAQFAEGRRYEDFDPSTDRIASYGLAGLIAGGIGVVALKKTGLIAIGLLLLKKGWIVVLALGGAIMGLVRRMFGGGSKSS